jgi:hypothetical protein
MHESKMYELAEELDQTRRQLVKVRAAMHRIGRAMDL